MSKPAEKATREAQAKALPNPVPEQPRSEQKKPNFRQGDANPTSPKTENLLQILHLEDNEDDAELVRLRLRSDGLLAEIFTVQDAAAFTESLQKWHFDVILADYDLVGFDGMAALQIARVEAPETPFIFVSGRLGEEAAVESIKHGATDFVPKNHLIKLVPAVRRALREVSERKARLYATRRTSLFASLGHRLSSVYAQSEAAAIIVDVADALLGWDACSLDEYSADGNRITPILQMDTVGSRRIQVSPGYVGRQPSQLIQRVLSDGPQLILRQAPAKLTDELTPFGDHARPSASLMFVPIRHHNKVLGILSIQSYKRDAYTAGDLETLQALADHCGGAFERIHVEEASLRLGAIVESSSDAIVGKTTGGIITSWNRGAEAVFGYAASEAIGRSVLILMPPERQHEELEILDRIRAGLSIQHFETVRVQKDGRRINVSVTISPIKDASGNIIGASKIARDISERKQAEVRLSAFSTVGYRLSSASTPLAAATIIGEITQELFGWDALGLDLYNSTDDTMRPIMYVDTIQGKKAETTWNNTTGKPTAVDRRVIAAGAELVLKSEPLVMCHDGISFGDKQRPSASIMRVPIRYGTRVVGILSVHSYRLKAYDEGDLATLRAFADYCGGALERIRAEEKIAALDTQLLNAARRAGMEEVANNVLHNVGNVLNSVNVSALLVVETLGKSKLADLAKVNELLRAHATDLETFISRDPQGKQLPGYLELLGQSWNAEQSGMRKELEYLVRNINHIKNIIARQQSLFSAAGLVEMVALPELFEDALTITASNWEQSGIQVKRDCAVQAPVYLDRIKFMLILVNLVGNARDSLLASGKPGKTLTLRAKLDAAGKLIVEVIDTGGGIPPENLPKIFSHGFTTKKGGHGFGLHSSALAAKELGGSLRVESEGRDRGAAFILELPVKNGESESAT